MLFPVLTPATTSSPCALIRYSPSISFLPLCPFLVNTTPVALSSPIFPNTIVTTLTAVPFAISFVMLFFSRYTIALSPIQLLKTASIDNTNCSSGVSGNFLLVCSSQIFLYSVTIFFNDSTFNLLSSITPCFSFAESKT